jgi:translation initiation factor 2B subunit (eIF-2B alpha/beta/delta family)
MSADWERVVARIRQDRRSGASALLARGIEAARLLVRGTPHTSPARLTSALERFTLRLTASQPSMATFLTLANALWLGREGGQEQSPTWKRVRDALVEYAGGIDGGLRATVRHAASLVRPRSLVLTYSNSAAVRLALWQARAAGRRFEVVCSESRPMREGVALARRLAALGIPAHLVVDAALAEWVGRASLVLLGADAVTGDVVVNKVGTETILQAARRAGAPAYVLADASKWLPDDLARFWRVREENPGEIARPGAANLMVHNRYFGMSSLSLIAGVVWEGGVARPSEVRRRIARLPVAGALLRFLARKRAMGRLSREARRASGKHAGRTGDVQ